MGTGEPVGYFDGAGGAASALPNTPLLWDIESRQPLASFTLEDFPNVCALSEDGQTAVVGDRRTAHLLKFRTGTAGVVQGCIVP